MITVHDLEVRAGARLLMEHVTFRVADGPGVGPILSVPSGSTPGVRLAPGVVLHADPTPVPPRAFPVSVSSGGLP